MCVTTQTKSLSSLSSYNWYSILGWFEGVVCSYNKVSYFESAVSAFDNVGAWHPPRHWSLAPPQALLPGTLGTTLGRHWCHLHLLELMLLFVGLIVLIHG